MKKVKSNINIILRNWHVIKALNTVEASDIVIPIEQAIDKLARDKEFTDLDLLILDAYQHGYNIKEISRLTKITRQTISFKLNNIFTRLSTSLGEI